MTTSRREIALALMLEERRPQTRGWTLVRRMADFSRCAQLDKELGQRIARESADAIREANASYVSTP